MARGKANIKMKFTLRRVHSWTVIRQNNFLHTVQTRWCNSVRPCIIRAMFERPESSRQITEDWDLVRTASLCALRNLDDNAQIKSDAEIPGVNHIHGKRSVPEAYNYRAQAFDIELATSGGIPMPAARS